MNTETSQQSVKAQTGGIAVYFDQDRQLTDVATENRPETWKPANVAAQKLFRCIESLRDIEVLLPSAGRSKNKTKQRRQLKILHTPLHSLVEAIRDLANDLENNPDTVCRLPDGARQLIPQMKSQLLQISTIAKGGLLSLTRNKIAAHVDTGLSAEEMQILLSKADAPQIGLWLHTCVAVLADFIKLPVYFWSCECREHSVRILFNEPFVVTLGFDPSGRPNRLIDIHIPPQPPRREVAELMVKVVNVSKWMFGSRSVRVAHFEEDKPEDPLAKSLRWLPHLSGCPAKISGHSVVPKVSTSGTRFLIIPQNAPFFVNGLVHRLSDNEDFKIEFSA